MASPSRLTVADRPATGLPPPRWCGGRGASTARLAEVYPDAHCELDFDSPFQLLVATVLSAQCTDVRVNQVTPALFARFPDARGHGVGAARGTRGPDPVDRILPLEGDVASSRFRGDIVALHDGEVPGRLEDLVKLRGVGRKTANVVLGQRLRRARASRSTRTWAGWRDGLGLTVNEDPVAVENATLALIERREWTLWSHRIIFHGRRRCTARKPDCGGCEIARWCPSAGTFG